MTGYGQRAGDWDSDTWGRTKPAPPVTPPLQAGDVVWVQATVVRVYAHLGAPWVAVEVDGSADLVHVEPSRITRQVNP